jgi:hypothetical protein
MFAALFCVFLMVCGVFGRLFLRPPTALAWFPRVVRRLVAKVLRLAVMPKVKLVISFYQSVMAVPRVYDVQLPESYFKWIDPIYNLVELDWSKWVMPGKCVATSVASRLVIIGLLPIAMMIAAALIGVVAQMKNSTKHLSLGEKITRTLPVVLMIAFCFCVSVSQTIFSAWDCVTFKVDSSNGILEGHKRSFLRQDLSVECDEPGSISPDSNEHRQILDVACVFVAVWPIGCPLFFLWVLGRAHKAIMQKRRTPLSRATAVLHQEYEPDFFWWE